MWFFLNYRAKSIDTRVSEVCNENKSTKRRRSYCLLEEAVITVLDAPKRQCTASPQVVVEGTPTKISKQSNETRKVNIRRNSIKDSNGKQKNSPKVSNNIESPKSIKSKVSTTEDPVSKVNPVVINVTNTNNKDKSQIAIKNLNNEDAVKSPKHTNEIVKTGTTSKTTLKVKPIKLRRSSKFSKSATTPTKKQNDTNEKNNSSILDNSNKASTSTIFISDSPERKDDMDESMAIRSTSTPKNTIDKSQSSKDRIVFVDDATLSLLNPQSEHIVSPVPGFPTISNIRSLSTTNSPSKTTISQSVSNSDTSSSTKSNTNDSMAKLQKIQKDGEKTPAPPLGRVEVRSFARMSSIDIEKDTLTNSANKNKEQVEIEVKAEPMDYDDPERQAEKMEILNTIKLRPVNQTSNLREIRLTKVTAGGGYSGTSVKKPVVKQVEIRPKAKKTFPQPKKADESRSDLNSKNSMVYIPIQPPVTQAPVRPTSAVRMPTSRPNGPVLTPVSIHRPLNTHINSIVSSGEYSFHFGHSVAGY